MISITLRAPMSHGEFGAPTGNATQFRRIALRTGQRVPAVSGNALRGVMRRVVMRDMLAQAGLSVGGPGWDILYASLVNGGHLEGSESALDPAHVRELREALPSLSLFGAALQTWMLKGRMRVGISWPQCAETAAIGLVAPGNYPPAELLISEMSHVRHIDRDMQDPAVSGVTPMPTTMETLVAGTVLETMIGFDRNATALERSCAGWALNNIGALGGKSSVGLGLVEIKHDIDGTLYEAWRAEIGADSKRWLTALTEKLMGKKEAKRAAKAATNSED